MKRIISALLTMPDIKKLLEQLDPLQKTLSGLGEGSAAFQAARDALDPARLAGSQFTAEGAAMEIARAAAEPFENGLSAAYAAENLSQFHPSVFGVLDLKEQKRLTEERQMNEQIEASREWHQNVMRQQHAVQKREDDKVAYARRSAEASEAALAIAEERRRAAEADATQAKEAAFRAEARAEQAETREIEMKRLAWLGILVALASLAVAAWSILKDQV